jgi:hypothetical protein
LVQPQKEDRVMILIGESAGSIGELIGIENEEAIVQSTADDIQVFTLPDLAKFIQM